MKTKKNKTILIFYINIGNLNDDEIESYMINVADHLKEKEDDSILSYFIPTRESETRVECVNPRIISYEENDVLVSKLEKIKNNLEEIIKTI
jgi:hypothetical protein